MRDHLPTEQKVMSGVNPHCMQTVEIASQPCYSLLSLVPLGVKWLLLFPVQPSGSKVFALSWPLRRASSLIAWA
jgi:hypothetical protein